MLILDDFLFKSACWVFLFFLLLLLLLNLFKTICSGTLSECQTVWIQIRTDIFVGPDLGSNCLQRLLAEDKSRRFNLKICQAKNLEPFLWFSKLKSNHVQIYNLNTDLIMVLLVGLWFKVPFNNYGHVEMVSSLNTLFPGQAWTKQLTSTLCTYFHL